MNTKILLEICVDTFESAVAAAEGGADRIELCSALSEGGLTPTIGLLRTVKMFLEEWFKLTGNFVPVYCMIRCRRGSDFQYSESDMKIMICDVKLLKENGADGFAFGALDEFGNIHRSHCEQVVKAANENGAFPLTFHRAIDCTNKSKLRTNIQHIANLGFTTILTSGLEPSAEEGVQTIAQMKKITEEIQQDTGKLLQIMPGSGVCIENVLPILNNTTCVAIHGSASVLKSSPNQTGAGISMGGSNVDALPIKICSKAKVEALRKLIGAL